MAGGDDCSTMESGRTEQTALPRTRLVVDAPKGGYVQAQREAELRRMK